MLTISKPWSAAQVRTYHATEFRNGRDNYYAASDEIVGQWHGQLAARLGLHGDVRDEQIERLAEGRHPFTDEPMVQHQTARTYTNLRGQTVTTMEHRAGWDATFSAPKSVSLTALVGGDARVAEAHRESVRAALDEMERYVQARIGRSNPPETTRAWIAATFEHDSARPVDGYAAPQLHTHVVIFNVTERANGDTRSVQPRELYRTQSYATALYRSELAMRLTTLGYRIERGTNGQPEIAGYTAEYLEASSPRRRQIEAHLAAAEKQGAAAAQIAAHRTRESKRDISHGEMQRRHAELATRFGGQPEQIIAAARRQAQQPDARRPRITAETAVTFARDRNLEREAVVDERMLYRDALRRSMGEVPSVAIRAEFHGRVATGEFVGAAQPSGAASRAFTTRDMIALERDNIDRMRAGQGTRPPIARDAVCREVGPQHPRLNPSQQAAVDQILRTRDVFVALEGVAGSGKTTALAAIRDTAQREGYIVDGLAPTSRATQALAEAGIPATTLQRHLVQGRQAPDGRPHLFVLDESSLASTVQVHEFLDRLGHADRVLLVGDVRQHQSVEAGRPYQQLQEVGMQTARLDVIVRQRDEALKSVVEQLSRGEIHRALWHLDRQGRVHELPARDHRYTAIARAYAAHPEGTLVVSPDNASRQQINDVIHRTLQASGHVQRHQHVVRVLVGRQDLTGADRQWAKQYEPGDLVRYTTGSKRLQIRSGDYARVERVRREENVVTVRRQNGDVVSYDPRRLHGVAVYRKVERAFAVGDRVQTTAPYPERHVANRELGRIEQVDAQGRLVLRLDSGRRMTFDVRRQPHLDYGYAVTSHSSQGQTADRVLVHIDANGAGEQLVNRRLAYVAVSRGRYDVQIYTDDKVRLADALSRDVSHRSAIPSEQRPESQTREVYPGRSASKRQQVMSR
jgi:conjugative relaxase-like TrwC/TraI family protein